MFVFWAMYEAGGSSGEGWGCKLGASWTAFGEVGSDARWIEHRLSRLAQNPRAKWQWDANTQYP